MTSVSGKESSDVFVFGRPGIKRSRRVSDDFLVGERFFKSLLCWGNKMFRVFSAGFVLENIMFMFFFFQMALFGGI